MSLKQKNFKFDIVDMVFDASKFDLFIWIPLCVHNKHAIICCSAKFESCFVLSGSDMAVTTPSTDIGPVWLAPRAVCLIKCGA